jgi:hypothetical protein
MGRAWVSGFSAVFLAHLAWFCGVAAAAHVDGLMPLIVLLVVAVLNVAGLAAFMVARRARRFGLLLGLTMAPLGAALGTASNMLFGSMGIRVDFSGFYNNAGLFVSLLSYGTLLAAIGGALGMRAGRTREQTSAPLTTTPDFARTLPEMAVAPAAAADDLPQIRSD